MSDLGRWTRQATNRGEKSELQEPLSEDPGLEPAHLQLLTAAEQGDMCSTRHRADLCDQLEIRKRSSTEADEVRRIEPAFEILEPVGDRVSLLLDRRDVQELAFGHDRRDLMDRDDQDFLTMSHRNPLEIWGLR